MANPTPHTTRKDMILPPLDEIADAIVKLSNLAKQINQSRLSRKAILILLSHMCKIGQKDIDIILHNLPLMEREYLKPLQQAGGK